ncbi:MAG: patatin-like phospholipase family protein [Hyphomicrobium sp.]
MRSMMTSTADLAAQGEVPPEPVNAAGGKGQIVLVLQGGGALGAFQAGVYAALHEAGIEPDWVIGTSIGAINGALIVGNEPENRVAALREFWQSMAQKPLWQMWSPFPQLNASLGYWSTLTAGVPGFFSPNPLAFCGLHVPLGAENAGYYSTAPLERTLSQLVDVSLISRNRTRLTVGAAQVRTSRMRYFDSREEEIGIRHIMASGALPPAFPPIRIDGELYWDGGIMSNTPAEAIFDDSDRQDSLVFAVHMWNPAGAEPNTLWEVMHRHKDIQYSSRVATHVARQAQAHRLRHVINELAGFIPGDVRERDEVRRLTEHGCLTRMHVVRLLAPGLDKEDHTKDVDFSRAGIRNRWEAGYRKTLAMIEAAPWTREVDPLDGVYLHELTETVALDEMAPVVPPPAVCLPGSADQWRRGE